MDMNDQAGTEPGDDGAPSVVEALLYGPLGLVLEARTLMPRLVQRGRNEVSMARTVGQFAIRKGTGDLAAGALVGQEKLLGILRSKGLFPSGSVDDTASSTIVERPSPSTVSAHDAAKAAGIDSADLAIVGYDMLSASQVVPRLESLTAAELELVALYEAGTRGRKTILSKVEQLRSSASPDR
jgi:hypothetical protein